MTWPTTATKVNLDASGDDPKLARAELVSLIDKFNELQAHVTAFAQGILDDANAAAAQTTLGISTYIKTLIDDADAATARATLVAAGTGVANTFTATQRWSKGADVASANALTLGADGNYFDITGTTAITSIGTKGIGTVVKLHFDAILTLTHHATDLILPGGASITTAAGDEAEFIEYASADWRCTAYTKASGLPVVTAAVGIETVLGTATASGVATVDIEAGTWSAYTHIKVVVWGMVPASSVIQNARIKVAGAYVTAGNYTYNRRDGNTITFVSADPSIRTNTGSNTDATNTDGVMTWMLFNVNSSRRKHFMMETAIVATPNDTTGGSAKGWVSDTGAVSGLRIYMASGNISLSYAVIGIKYT